MTSLEAFYQHLPHVAEDETLADMEVLSKTIGDGEIFLDWLSKLLENIEGVQQ